MEVINPEGGKEDAEEEAQRGRWRQEERDNYWKMMQSYIGSDVTSMVTLPVLIFEPMTMLQKMAELMERIRIHITWNLIYFEPFDGEIEGGYTVETVFDGSKLGFEPYSVEISSDGEFFILDSQNSNIYKIFNEFLQKDYGGPGTLLIEPFTDMMVALKEKNRPGAQVAARASLLWAQNYVDQDWEDWNSKTNNDASHYLPISLYSFS